MDLVTLAALCALQAGEVAAPDPLAPWRPLIAEAAREFGISDAWIGAVMRAESGGRAMVDGRPITSAAGAIGLMQVMPATYAEMRLRHGLGPDPAEPRDNIRAGSAYLRAMVDRFGCPAAFAAYHAGPERVEAHLRDGRKLPAETESYLFTLAAQASGRSQTPNGEAILPPWRRLFVGLTAASTAGSDAQILPQKLKSGRTIFVVVRAHANQVAGEGERR
ncbi:MAG: transglycosylase SLT domain-containing protein [Magnetospirillum sp.]|nr:transglycosylase SLT domain-containing protein [Magnetospirillum sp.]